MRQPGSIPARRRRALDHCKRSPGRECRPWDRAIRVPCRAPAGLIPCDTPCTRPRRPLPDPSSPWQRRPCGRSASRWGWRAPIRSRLPSPPGPRPRRPAAPWAFPPGHDGPTPDRPWIARSGIRAARRSPPRRWAVPAARGSRPWHRESRTSPPRGPAIPSWAWRPPPRPRRPGPAKPACDWSAPSFPPR